MTVFLEFLTAIGIGVVVGMAFAGAGYIGADLIEIRRLRRETKTTMEWLEQTREERARRIAELEALTSRILGQREVDGQKSFFDDESES